MPPTFEELDYQQTPLGELVLRRRRSPSVPDEWVYEVTIGGEMLMSSTVNASERALARLALDGRGGEVLVGGLGLGYTAAEALAQPGVRRVEVIELLPPVIDWHRRRLVPMAAALLDNARCDLVEGNFFECADSAVSNRRYDAILLDIDHAPNSLLDERHARFYTPAGLRGMAGCLRPGGVFALWSAWEPEAAFIDALGGALASVRRHAVPFYNPHTSRQDVNWVVVAEQAHGASVCEAPKP